MSTLPTSVPVLTCDQARELEARLFQGGEPAEWAAMCQAGAAVAEEVQRDFLEIGVFPRNAHVVVLAGKGHNAGDALIAAHHLLARHEGARVTVIFVFGSRTLRPLAARAWRELQQFGRERVCSRTSRDVGGAFPCDLCLDGVFGFQFRPPVDPALEAVFATVNRATVGLRAAVDLPSADRFRADFTYATGSVKRPLLESANAGRLRYLDLGFFAGPMTSTERDRVLTLAALEPLRQVRVPATDKRSYGHVFIVGGSRSFPGAALMATMAAVRGGAGLVTAFVPESLAAAFAARLPEAMWVGWPETPEGGLALEGEHLLRDRLARADAVVLGPGAGREPETRALFRSIAESLDVPLVFDADALQPEIVSAGSAKRVLTPHAGEFARLAGDRDLLSYANGVHGAVVLKGPTTRVCADGTVYHSPFGGPVLARGGSGDLLAGLMGAQLAQSPSEPLAAAARAVVWHGHAADLLARSRGQVAVRTTELLDYLAPALRCSSDR